MIRGTSLAILALLALVVLATGSVFAGPRQQAMDDATLSSLSLSDVVLDPAFASGTTMYTGTAAYDVEETTVTATPANSSSTVVITYQDGQSFPDRGRRSAPDRGRQRHLRECYGGRHHARRRYTK